MRLSNVAGSEVLTIPFAYALATILQSIVLVIAFRYTFSLRFKGIGQHAIRCLVAAIAGGATAYVTLNFVVAGINPDTFMGIFIQ